MEPWLNAQLLPGREQTWAKRLRKARPMIAVALDAGLEPTPWAVEALAYWERANKLQNANLAGKKVKSGDALQDAIPIYDTTRRRYAGFSNVLEQLRYGEGAPKYKANLERGFNYPSAWDSLAPMHWMYLCLVHRVTGSGASFEWDHGWRNTIVPEIANAKISEAAAAVLGCDRPMFTSIGNQIPQFNKKTMDGVRTAGQEYLATVAPKLVLKTFNWLADNSPVGIKEAVDKVLEFQQELGCKRFVFVLTAWVMDIAEYLPHLVDPTSDVYHGANAQEALRLCFNRKAFKGTNQQFYDAGTRTFCNVTGTNPMDVEDAAPGCDLIRWAENYVPKHGFDWVLKKGIYNSSCLVYDKGRQPEAG